MAPGEQRSAIHTPVWPHPAHTAPFVSLGVMSGTSADGCDAVMLRFERLDRPHTPRVLGSCHVAYPDHLRDELMRPDKLNVRRVAELHALLPSYYAQAVRGIDRWQDALCCAVHGQTLWHAPHGPNEPTTLQIGSSAKLAQLLGLPIVGDMRMADVAYGGQGAPLVPLAHWFFAAPKTSALWVVNFGGICNVSHVTPKAEDVIGFDVGPGMMLSDGFVARETSGQQNFDKDGYLSKGGKLLPRMYAAIVDHPYLLKPPPKSTGRELFGHAYLQALLDQHRQGARAEDVAYTLLAATAEGLKRAIDLLPSGAGHPKTLLLSGGGAYNPTLVAEVRARFASIPVETITDGPLSTQVHEAASMALIGARTYCGLPSGLIRVTGAKHSAILGHVHMPTR